MTVNKLWRPTKGPGEGYLLDLAPGVKATISYDAAVERDLPSDHELKVKRWVVSALNARLKKRFKSVGEAQRAAEAYLKVKLTEAITKLDV